ncbi:MAG: VTT domain-containing protein [Vicinamibacterales bacterium]
MIAAIQEWASQLGGVGLLIIAALDSSFLSFPQVNDLLVILLSTKNPERMPYYAAMTTLGSLIGCFFLWGVARKGGEVFLRKRFSAERVDRGMAVYQRFGLLAVIVPALLPPPTPFKIFVLLAGAAGVSPWKFGLAILLGRGVRYFGQGYLAVRYGEQAGQMVRDHGATVGIALAALVLVAGVAFYFISRRQRSQPSRAGRSAGSNAR